MRTGLRKLKCRAKVSIEELMTPGSATVGVALYGYRRPLVDPKGRDSVAGQARREVSLAYAVLGLPCWLLLHPSQCSADIFVRRPKATGTIKKEVCRKPSLW